MRQLFIQVPISCQDRLLRVIKQYDAANIALIPASDGEATTTLCLAHVANSKVDALLRELESIPGFQVSFMPHGVLALQPPADAPSDQLTSVSPRGPIEIFLSGLQSIGSWKSFLAYAAGSGAVVWTGLFTETVYLLVAAMLIAPFAGPAMNVALGTARGDSPLVRQGLLRYLAALAVAILVAAGLTAALQQESVTAMMQATSEVSMVAVILPLMAGAMGALSQTQSERNSLVSGAATGVLVAASLAPQAGIIGMAGVLGEWDLVKRAVFVLLLQLAGINLAGALVFRCYGLKPQEALYQRGRGTVFALGVSASIAVLGALLAWQFSAAPDLLRSSQAQRVAVEVREALEESGVAQLVDVDTRFTRSDLAGQNTLLVVAYAQRLPRAEEDDKALESRLADAIQKRIVEKGYNVAPLVKVTLLRPLN